MADYTDDELRGIVSDCLTDEKAVKELDDIAWSKFIEYGSEIRAWLERRGVDEEMAWDEELPEIQLLFACWDALEKHQKGE